MDEKPSLQWRVVTQSYATAFRLAPLASVIVVAALGWSAVSTVVTLWLTKSTTDSAIHYVQVHRGLWSGPIFWLAVTLLFSAAGRLIGEIQRYQSRTAEKKTSLHIQEQLYQTAASAPLTEFERPEFYDRLQRAEQASGHSLFGIFAFSFQCTQALIQTIVIGGIFITINPWLLVALIVANLPSLISQVYLSKRMQRAINESTPEQRKLSYLESVMLKRELAKEIRLFALGPYITDQWFAISKSVANRTFAAMWRNERARFLLSLATSICYVGCIGVVATVTIRQSLSIGFFIAFMTAIQQFQGSCDLLTNQFGFLVSQTMQMKQVFDFVDTHRPVVRDWTAMPKAPYKIEFDRVSFRYPGSENDVLSDVSFRLQPLEKVALIGANGAGKSTLTKLLLGLYAPTSGTIWINDVDLQTIDPSQRFRSVSAVFQEYAKFQLRFRENIGFGQVVHLTEDTKLLGAADKVEMSPVIEESPQGLDTPLGNQFTAGRDLSGGQWQRLAMARSHLREGAITVMDEPTSALDPRAEAKVYERFLELSSGCTAVYVSHRVGLARLADRVLVLRDGRLIENGSHDELLAQNGEYADFFQTQAEWYRSSDTAIS